MAFSVASAPPLVKKTLSRSCALGDESGCLGTGLVGEGRRDGALAGRGLLDRRDELGVLVADVDVDELAREAEVAVPSKSQKWLPDAPAMGRG